MGFRPEKLSPRGARGAVLALALTLLSATAVATTVLNNGYTAKSVTIAAGTTTATDPCIIDWPYYRGVALQLTASATLTAHHQCLVNGVWRTVGITSVPISPVIAQDSITTYCEQVRELVYGGASTSSITVRCAAFR